MPNTNGTISEVIVGTGVLYVAAISNDGNASGDYVAFPTDDGAGAWSDPAASWVDVGYSEDGWTLEMDKTFEDIMVMSFPNIKSPIPPFTSYSMLLSTYPIQWQFLLLW